MVLEIFKVIAMLCIVSAGDTPSLGFTHELVEKAQTHCHRYYVTCLEKKKDMATCVKERD